MFEELFESEAGLFKDVGKRTFCKLTVNRNHGFENLVSRASFKSNVTSFLAEFHKSNALQSSNDALTGNTREFRDVTATLRLSSKTNLCRTAAPPAGPRFLGRAGWLPS